MRAVLWICFLMGIVAVATYCNQPVLAEEGKPPYEVAVVSGSLPEGLSLDGSTANITDNPDHNSVDTNNFTIRVTDSASPAAKRESTEQTEP